jgi:hypothetical protein
LAACFALLVGLISRLLWGHQIMHLASCMVLITMQWRCSVQMLLQHVALNCILLSQQAGWAGVVVMVHAGSL